MTMKLSFGHCRSHHAENVNTMYVCVYSINPKEVMYIPLHKLLLQTLLFLFICPLLLLICPSLSLSLSFILFLP